MSDKLAVVTVFAPICSILGRFPISFQFLVALHIGNNLRKKIVRNFSDKKVTGFFVFFAKIAIWRSGVFFGVFLGWKVKIHISIFVLISSILGRFWIFFYWIVTLDELNNSRSKNRPKLFWDKSYGHLTTFSTLLQQGFLSVFKTYSNGFYSHFVNFGPISNIFCAFCCPGCAQQFSHKNFSKNLSDKKVTYILPIFRP